MKHIVRILCAILCMSGVSAQSLLPLDEKGKVSFAEVTKADSLKTEQLYANAKSWLADEGGSIVVSPEDSLAGRVAAQQSFYVYARGYLSKKIHGQITYTAVIEVKDNKYRYSFSNFVFHYYKEDRNYKMIPSGKTKALEEQKASGWQSQWESHKRITGDHITAQIRSLKVAMVKLPQIKTEPVITKQSTKAEW